MSFKGIGQINISETNNTLSFRLAFIGSSAPALLRFAVIDISGRPVETFAFNGDRIYLQSHTGQHPFISRKSNRGTLERIISIRISPNDIIQLLSGKIPAPTYEKAFLTNVGAQSKCIVLFLKNKIRKKIFINENNNIEAIDVYNKRGLYSYGVKFVRLKTFSTFHIPTEIIISNKSGAKCTLAIDRYWPNVDYSPEIFTLTNK